MEKLNPDALAECGDSDLNAREGVQPVDGDMIAVYVHETGKLPVNESARAFGAWLDYGWCDRNEKGEHTNAEVIEGALIEWRGV